MNIMEASPEQRPALLESYLVQLASVVVGLPPAEIDPEATLRDLGLDSLMAMDIKQKIEDDLLLVIPVSDLIRGPSPRQLAEQLARSLLVNAGTSTALASSASVVAANGSDGSTAPATAVDIQTKLWFRRRTLSSKARLRLFCFPYGGGSDFTYRTWGDFVPEEIEVCPVKLPGREDRREERPFETFPPLLDALEQAMEPLLDKPFAFFGTSMGGLIGFELARRLRDARGLSPTCIFIAATPPPHRVASVTETLRAGMDSEASEMGRVDALRRLGLMTDSLLKHFELVEAFLPVMQADFRLMASFAYKEPAPVHCPISVFGGSDDMLIQHDDLKGWIRYTHGEFCSRTLSGDHMFVNSARERLLQAVAQDIARYS